MSNDIFGVINIDFPTNKEITQEQFRMFKKGLHKLIDDSVEMMIYDLANECGFEADNYHPIILEYITCDGE